MEPATLEPIYRLSVIIPTYNRRALTERAVRSVLEQKDPIGTEVIVADDASTDGTPDNLRAVFADAIAAKRLRVETFERSRDPGNNRNRGAARAQGTFLAFLDSDDWWRPGRLEWLEPLLKKHDLILATDEPVAQSSDWLESFLRMNWAITSSAVIRRSLFDEMGGFPENYYAIPFPESWPGWEDYELWLRCLIELRKRGQRERFLLVRNQHVAFEPQPAGAGRVKLRIQMLREARTLLNIASKLPPKYWPTLARRVAGAGKAIVKG